MTPPEHWSYSPIPGQLLPVEWTKKQGDRPSFRAVIFADKRYANYCRIYPGDVPPGAELLISVVPADQQRLEEAIAELDGGGGTVIVPNEIPERFKDRP